jgi:hypothetical protein
MPMHTLRNRKECYWDYSIPMCTANTVVGISNQYVKGVLLHVSCSYGDSGLVTP